MYSEEITIGFHHGLQMNTEFASLSDEFLVKIFKCCLYPCLQVIIDVSRSIIDLWFNCAPHIRKLQFGELDGHVLGVMRSQNFSHSYHWVLLLVVAEAAGVVEYIDCFSADGLHSPLTSVLDMTQNNLMVMKQ